MSAQDAFIGDTPPPGAHAVSTSPHASGLSVSTAVAEDRCTLTLRGELDLSSRSQLDSALAQLQLGRMRTLALDLGGVSFMDSSGVHAVMTVKALCAEHDCQLVLASRSAAVQRLLELTGVLAQLRLDGAVKSCSPGLAPPTIG
jgi:anti-anti-sigma factor